MSEILNEININDYNVQKMQGNGGGGGTEDLSVVLAAQDTALSTQETKIAQAIQALADKKSIDLAEETSDATATANDIKQGKTAYVNGVKVEGSLEVTEKAVLPNGVIFSGSTATNFDWLKDVDVSNITNMKKFFYNCTNITTAPAIDTTNVTTMEEMFKFCSSLQTIPELNTENVGNMKSMLGNSAIVNIPIFNLKEVTVCDAMFSNCSNLTNESLNNILAMCITTSNKFIGQKRLSYLGLTSAQATTCQSLSNWDAFVAAGWTSGY